MGFLNDLVSKVKWMGKKHLKYSSVEQWMEAENIPKNFVMINNDELRDKYITQYAELREHLYAEHVKSLPSEDQRLIESGNHPSQKHSLAHEAEKYATNLKNELCGLVYINDISVGLYHGDRVIISVEVDEKTTKEEINRIPWLYRGFEVKTFYINKRFEPKIEAGNE